MTFLKSSGLYLVLYLMVINYAKASMNVDDSIHLNNFVPTYSAPLLGPKDTRDNTITINDPQLKPAQQFLRLDLNFQIINARVLKAGAALSGTMSATLIGLKAFDKLPESTANPIFYATLISSSATLFLTGLYQYATQARAEIVKELSISDPVKTESNI